MDGMFTISQDDAKLVMWDMECFLSLSHIKSNKSKIIKY